jgi:hypothetical protein
MLLAAQCTRLRVVGIALDARLAEDRLVILERALLATTLDAEAGVELEPALVATETRV